MKFRIFIALLFAQVISIASYAQNESDAQRYSNNVFMGTARYAAMGGAFSALGGDFTSLSTNPAGLGVYRSSEITFTPSLEMNNIKSNYFGKDNNALKTTLVVNNLGLVLNNELDHPEWKYLSLGVGYNRLYSFNDIFSVNNKNTAFHNSYMNSLITGANGYTPAELINIGPIDSDLAYDTYVINPTLDDSTQYIGWPGSTDQNYTSERSGRIGETVISFAANYNDKLYLGATIGIQGVDYESRNTFTENVNDNPDFDNYTYTNNTTTEGSGVNFKLGMIYKPEQWLRLGAAVHTPTFFNLTNSYSYEMSSRFKTPDDNNNLNYSSSYDPEFYEYRLVTPLRVIASAAFLLKQKGLISIEYERVNNGRATLKSANNGLDNYNFSAENDVISNFFTASNVLRAGLEYKIVPTVSLRGGYAHFTNPAVEEAFIGTEPRQQFSGGIGFRSGRFFADMAYVHTRMNEEFNLYSNPVSGVNLNYFQDSAILTLGLKF